jgi:hypothetical protein
MGCVRKKLCDPHAVCSSVGLSHEDNLTKSRLLSLSALGTQTTSGEISYKQVEETLQVRDSRLLIALQGHLCGASLCTYNLKKSLVDLLFAL